MWRGYYTKSDVMKQHANVPTCTCSNSYEVFVSDSQTELYSMYITNYCK